MQFIFSIIIIFSLAIKQRNTQVPPVTARLVGGELVNEGRVELLYQGQWGSVCSDGWDNQDGAVICRMLGYVGAARAIIGTVDRPTQYGPGTGPIFLRAVQCEGNEAVITACPLEGWSITKCTHNEDAGVICLGVTTTPPTSSLPPRSTTTTGPPRICNNPNTNVRLMLSDGTVGSTQGRVLIRYQNVFRSICSQRWGFNEAAVLCSMLCFNPANARAVLGRNYGNATEGFWLSWAQCLGNETDLALCQHSAWGDAGNCDVTDAAGVLCVEDATPLSKMPTPTVNCPVSEQISASFSLIDEPRLTVANLNVSSSTGQPVLSNCSATYSTNRDFIVVSIPFNSCGTERSVNATFITYTNYVLYVVPSSLGIITRTESFLVRVSCQVIRASTDNTLYNPQTRSPPPQAANSTYNVQLLLFQDSSFHVVLAESPLRVVLGDWLFVGGQLISLDQHLRLILVDIFVSASAAPDTDPMYYLVKNKCIVDSSVTLYPVNDTFFALRFKSFKFTTSSNFMYLHANSNVCPDTDFVGACDRTCTNPASRRRRRDAKVRQIRSFNYKSLETSLFIVVVESLASPRPGTMISISEATMNKEYLLTIFILIINILKNN